MIQWDSAQSSELRSRTDAEILRRRFARRREARRVRIRDNRIALGVLLFTVSYLAVHVAVWAARSLR